VLAVRPLLTPEEFAAYKKKIDDFAAHEGPRVQEHLKTLDKEAPFNWMEGFWQTMYLSISLFLQQFVVMY